jgi:hypothetical protein
MTAASNASDAPIETVLRDRFGHNPSIGDRSCNATVARFFGDHWQVTTRNGWLE